jgi:hypothetical protein
MQTSRKLVVRLTGLAGVGLLAAFYGPLAFDEIRAGYPGDALHAAALNDCAMMNVAFNRLDQEQRTACYARHQMGESGVFPNQVDLAASSARDHQVKTDVVQQQQVVRYLDARGARPVP